GGGSSISADGRFVAFEYTCALPLAGDVNLQRDIFARDLQAGTTRLVSVSSSGAQGNGVSYAPSISDDGRLVAFWSKASNLVRRDTNNESDVFVHDLQTGRTSRVSVSSAETQGNAGSFAHGGF